MFIVSLMFLGRFSVYSLKKFTHTASSSSLFLCMHTLTHYQTLKQARPPGSDTSAVNFIDQGMKPGYKGGREQKTDGASDRKEVHKNTHG